jgi:hypothetical protein
MPASAPPAGIYMHGQLKAQQTICQCDLIEHQLTGSGGAPPASVLAVMGLAENHNPRSVEPFSRISLSDPREKPALRLRLSDHLCRSNFRFGASNVVHAYIGVFCAQIGGLISAIQRKNGPMRRYKWKVIFTSQNRFDRRGRRCDARS